MLYQITLNFCLLFTFTLLIYWPFIHYFNFTDRWNKYLYLKPVFIGIAFGIVGAFMPYFTLYFFNGLILSARIIPILFCGLLGGPYALLIAGVIMTASRFLFYDVTQFGLIMSVNFALITLVLFILSKKYGIHFRNISYYFWAAIAEISIVILYLYNFSGSALQAAMSFVIFSLTAFYAIKIVLRQSIYTSNRVKETHALSYVDYLTQLPNNYAIDAYLKSLTLQSTPFSYLHIDIDQFHQYNFQHSYHIGDQILAEIASVLKRYGEQHDAYIGRIGGEEFCCILPNKPPALALYEADNIRKLIEGHTYLQHRQLLLHVTVSIGISTYPDNGPLLDNIYQNANRALRSISDQKTNKICHYNQYVKEHTRL